MDLDTLQQLAEMCEERLGKVAAQRRISHVLKVLGLCRKGPTTEVELVRRSGLPQPAVSTLLTKFRKEGLVADANMTGRGRKGLVLTEKGIQLLPDVEAAATEILQTHEAKQKSTEDTAGAAAETSKRDDIYTAMLAYSPDRVRAYEESRKHITKQRLTHKKLPPP